MDWTSRVSSSNVMRSSAAGADAAEPIKVNGATNAESNQRTTTQPTNDHETLYASYQHEHAGRGRVRRVAYSGRRRSERDTGGNSRKRAIQFDGRSSRPAGPKRRSRAYTTFRSRNSTSIVCTF